MIELVPHPRNPNQHPEKQIELLAKIIAHQGWRAPIVVSKRSGFIVAGHARYEAAKRLGLDEVPVDVQDFAREAEEYAHLVADNRIAELADLDEEAVAEIVRELRDGGLDAELAGYDSKDLDKLLGEIAAEADDRDMNYQSQFGVIVICKDEEDQKQAFERLTADGFNCRSS